MAFTLFTLTHAELVARFPLDPVVQKSTPDQFAAWYLESESYLSEECWGADKARSGVLYICAHLCNMEARGQSKPSRVGAANSVSTEPVSESYNVPETGQVRDRIWHTTIYGQSFVRLRSTVIESFIPLPKEEADDDECCPEYQSKGGLSSWRYH